MKIGPVLRNNKGFTIVELLISSTITLVVMISVLSIVVNFTNLSKNNQSSVRQVQESRFLFSVLSSDIKNAGSILTIANTTAFLTGNAYYTGIYPLNHTDRPDGVIITSGDPGTVTKLREPFKPDDATLGSSIRVPADFYDCECVTNAALDPHDGTHDCLLWRAGDFGIVIGKDGFYVFEVAVTPIDTDTVITPRAEAVYYSGLLNTTGYADNREGKPPSTVADADGNAHTYAINSPVMKVADFSIYLIREEFDVKLGKNRRDLIRIVDTFGIADVLAIASTDVKRYVIANNIWDLQIGYLAYPEYPAVTGKESYCLPGSTAAQNLLLYDELRNRRIREVSLNIIALTDSYINQKSIGSFEISSLGDRGDYTLPTNPQGKFDYSYKIYNMTIRPRNFGLNM